MGHSSPRVALIYLHATRERDQQIAAGMGRVYAEAKKAVPVHGHGQERTHRHATGTPCGGWAAGSRCRLVPELDSAARVVERRELRVTAEASEMVTVPRAELDALRAEVRRLRREVGRSMARARIEADPGPGDGSLTMSRSELAEAWGIGE